MHEFLFLPLHLGAAQKNDQFVGPRRHCLGYVRHGIAKDYPNGVVVIPGGLDHLGKHLRGGIAGQVDGVGSDGVGRYERGDGFDQMGRERGGIQAFLFRLVSGQNCRPPGSGDK